MVAVNRWTKNEGACTALGGDFPDDFGEALKLIHARQEMSKEWLANYFKTTFAEVQRAAFSVDELSGLRFT